MGVHVGKNVLPGLGKEFWLSVLAVLAVLDRHVGENVVPGFGKDFWVTALAGPELLGK